MRFVAARLADTVLVEAREPEEREDDDVRDARLAGVRLVAEAPVRGFLGAMSP